MKKILSLLALVLLSCMGAWAGTVAKINDFTGYSAAPVDSEWAVGTKWFMIQNIHSNGTTKFYLTPSGNYLPQSLPTASNLDSYLWAFVGDAENGFQLYNKAQGTNSILWANGSTRGMSASPTNSHVWDLYSSLADGKYLIIEHGTEHNAFNNGGQEGRLVTWNSEGALYGWNHTASNPTATGDDGSNFVISGAEEFNVVVNGLSDGGGVVIAGENHGAGTVETFSLLADAATAISVSGYRSTINVSGNTITVTYTEIPTMKDYNAWDVNAKGSAITNAGNTVGKYVAILGMDQQSNNVYYLYDNGTKIQGKEWSLNPELVWFVTEGAASGKYVFQNFKTGKYMNVPGTTNDVELNMSATPVELNFVFSGDYACINNGSQGIDVGWAGTNPKTWAGTTPAGSRRLQIFDVELVPAAVKATITYNYEFNGETVATENFQVALGAAYPDPENTFDCYTMTEKPEGTVSADDTHTFTLTWAGPFEPTTITDGAFAAETRWYYMENGSDKVNGYAVYGDGDKKSTFTTTAGNADTYKWAFVRKAGTPYFYLYNKAAGAVAMREQLSSNTGFAAAHNQGYVVANNTDVDMPLEVRVNGVGFALKLAAQDGTCLLGKHVDNNLSIWGNSASLPNDGSRFFFTEVPVGTDWAGLEAIIAEAEAIPYGDHLGQYSNPSFASELGEAQTMWTMHQGGMDAEKTQVDEAIFNLRTAINNLTLNMPAAGSFIRLKGGVSSEYADANAQADQTNRAARVGMSSDATGAGSIWYLDNSKHLISFSKGYYIKETCDLNGTADNASVFNFRASDRTIGRYGIYTSGARLYDNGAPADRNCIDRQGGAANETEKWILEEVTTLPVALTQVGELAYASFNAPVPVAVPSGVTAYKATINDNVLELTAFTGTNLAANTPVILTAAAANTYNFDIVASGDAFASDLQGTVAKQNVATGKTTYVLNKKEGKIGFYTSDTFINGFKAYCETTTAASNGLSFRFEDVVTAIDALHGNNSGAEIFDLQGRRLTKAQKGMNIINGHKVLVK